MWAVGEKGGESLKVPQVSAPNTGMGMGQEHLPIPFPSTSRSSHQANHQFALATVTENQPQNKHIEHQGNE